MITVLGSPMGTYSETSPCIVDNVTCRSQADKQEMGGCGIEIKKQGSPVVMLLMMEFDRGESVTYFE